MAATPTSTVNSSGVDRTRAASGPTDPTAALIGAILGAANGGLDTPGNPGTVVGGGMVSQAGLRNQLQASAAQAEADRQNVYNQVNQAILGRVPGLNDAYSKAGDALETDAAGRVASDQANSLQRASDAAQAARALGLSFVPSSGGADLQMAQNQKAYRSIADSWKGFDQAGLTSALDRNNMTADAFTHEGLQQQAALQQQLQAALSRAADYYVAGRVVGASKGSSLSPAQKLAALEYVTTYGQHQQATAAANRPKSTSSTSTTKINPDGSRTTKSKSTRG
jgi:hypothetical protein